MGGDYKQWRKDNPERARVIAQRYKKSHYEQVLAYQQKYNKLHPKRKTEWAHRTGKTRALSDAIDSSVYLGVYIAERALSKFFDHVVRMPYGNPGYDFLCGKGFKIDAKSAVLHTDKRGNRSSAWCFAVRRNSEADFFLCLAFDNRENLEPQHVWLIPGNLVNHLMTVQITNTDAGLLKFKRHEKTLEKVIACCAEMEK